MRLPHALLWFIVRQSVTNIVYYSSRAQTRRRHYRQSFEARVSLRISLALRKLTVLWSKLQ
ncbi:MAG: hypothetical protein JRN12_02520 [Nitrososphaerota archaeon]|jgi:hypothetical protein|nr:hypothetical protein [Nitrososphaerota archaeon]